MVAAFSFCESDHTMARELARHIECMGGVDRHHVLLICPEGVESKDIEDPIFSAFGNIHVAKYTEKRKGWPDGPNQCFAVAAEIVQAIPGNEPWLWLEADCVPVRPAWLDEIEAEYRFGQKDIMGNVNSTFGMDGKVSGQHVTGVAVYPHDFLKKCPVLRTIVESNAQYRAQGHLPPAFDCYIAPYVLPNYCESHTIQQFWKSHNFRESPDGIRCDFSKPYGASNVVRRDAVLIHGCKDFSLLDIIQRRLTATIP